MYIQVSDGVRNGVIKLETKLARGFFFYDLEILMAMNQCGPVFFSKIEIKGTFVSASH